MQAFLLDRPADLRAALESGAQAGRMDAAAEWIAGGTDLVQLLQENVRRPARLVDLRGVVGDGIEVSRERLMIGSGATMAQVAEHALVREQFPAIAQALVASASPQIRNMATIGGNLLQRTRCTYFRDDGVAACNKRRPGSGCAARDGESRRHAVLGVSEQCLAAHASDLAVTLVALGATVHTARPEGGRAMVLEDLYCLPGATPHIETVLGPGEVIAAVDIPAGPMARRSHYVKIRDRAAFDWALLSVAAGLDLDGQIIREACVAVGGVGTVPWRMRHVEGALRGHGLERAALSRAAARAGEGAAPTRHNAFKLELMERAIVRALEVAGGRP